SRRPASLMIAVRARGTVILRADILAAMLVGAVGAAGCRGSGRPNVLIITIDTLRADHVGCYGFGLAHTPAIDRTPPRGVPCPSARTPPPGPPSPCGAPAPS